MTEETTLNPDEMKKILKEYRIREKEEKKNQERLDKIHSQEEWLWNLESAILVAVSFDHQKKALYLFRFALGAGVTY